MGIIAIKIIISILLGVASAYISIKLGARYVSYKQGKYEVPKFERKINTKIYMLIYSLIGTLLTYILLMVTFDYKLVIEVIALFIFMIFAGGGTIVDNKIRIIGNEMILAMFGIGVIYVMAYSGLLGVLVSLITSIGIAVFFVIVYLLMRLVLYKLPPAGAGDFKLIMVIGFILGYPGIIIALFTTSVALLIYIAIGFMRKKLVMATYIPMAGFLMLGLVVALSFKTDTIMDVVNNTFMT